MATMTDAADGRSQPYAPDGYEGARGNAVPEDSGHQEGAEETRRRSVPPPPPPPSQQQPGLQLPPPPRAPIGGPPAPPPRPAPAEPPGLAESPRATNPVAIAALVVGLIALITGVFPITAPLGILLALVALLLAAIGITKSRGPNTRGTGAAVGGLVTGFMGLVAGLTWAALAILVMNPAEETSVDGLTEEIREGITSQLARTGPTRPVGALAVGDCYDQPIGGAEIVDVPVVDCAEPHKYEVFAVLQVPGDANAPFPGSDEVRRFSDGQCRGGAFADYVGANFYASPFVVTWIYPTEASWADGDREVVCALTDPTRLLTGSVRNSVPAAPEGPTETLKTPGDV